MLQGYKTPTNQPFSPCEQEHTASRAVNIAQLICGPEHKNNQKHLHFSEANKYKTVLVGDEMGNIVSTVEFEPTLLAIMRLDIT